PSWNSKFNGTLSFHSFPADVDLRKRWLVNIRRDDFCPTSNSKVCSKHFSIDQISEPQTPEARRKLVTVKALRPNLACAKVEELSNEVEELKKQLHELHVQPPHGPVTFVSQLYAGSMSDREIFKQCGITKRLTEDMAVMADKGFLISDYVSCKVYCPPFLSRLKQTPAHQVKETQAIARLRVNVERVIRRIKQKLFDGVITLSHSVNINQLFTVACLLSNYQNKALVKTWIK
uniref:THAP-type domain-containing protein n=1 Tax=Cyprinus carpio carpio TaxID=630221 RepID=A0A9J8A9A6_CYPCA